MRGIAPSFIGRTAGKRVPVFLADALIDRLDQILGSREADQMVEIVTDSNVQGLVGLRLRNVLRRDGRSVNLTVLPAGERIKSSRIVSDLHDRWFSRRYDRQTPVLALGGGTVGDVVGFAAATFMRGLPLWQIPTTIVAQVDAALGGKVGINHSRGKNLIGCFYQPSGIVIDPSLLKTLPIPERRSGLAEVVKYGVIADPALFRICERSLESWIDGEVPIPANVIARCAKIKLRVVATDETDHGARRALNFGHTLGHAFERWGNYRRLRHGEAVALGMIGAGWMAAQRGLWTEQELERLSRRCRHLRPCRIPEFNPSEVSVHLTVDKKRSGGRNVWVLPRQIGRIDYFNDVTDREIRGAVGYIAQWMKE